MQASKYEISCFGSECQAMSQSERHVQSLGGKDLDYEQRIVSLVNLFRISSPSTSIYQYSGGRLLGKEGVCGYELMYWAGSATASGGVRIVGGFEAPHNLGN